MSRPLNILILNHRDSFVYNLVRYIEELGANPVVVDSHKASLSDVATSDTDALLLSPGPCTPKDAGNSLDIVKSIAHRLPILGVCLGHQIIAEAFGWNVTRAKDPLYGEARQITHDHNGLFANLPNPLRVGLYHSLTAREIENTDLCVTARSTAGEVMGLRHKEAPIFGVQFHPESVLSDNGHDLLGNFLQCVRETASA